MMSGVCVFGNGGHRFCCVVWGRKEEGKDLKCA